MFAVFGELSPTVIQIEIKKLAEILNNEAAGVPNSNISAVCIDSRKASPGCVFFAIQGENYDGHNFITQAFEKGAACAVCRVGFSPRSFDKPIFYVNNTVEALGRLASYIRQHSKYKIIALTGSAGKTTTKNILSHVLKSKFKCFSSPKSFNNNIGVPLTVLDAPDDTEILISELGSNHPGEIEQLTQIIQPDIALITTVCPAHLEGFGSIEAIVKEKASISTGLRQGGKLYINGTIEKLVSHCGSQKLKFETFETPSDVKLAGHQSAFVIDNVKVILPLAGRANVENAMACWRVCKSLGFSAADFADSIASMKQVDMRMECIKLGSATVLADCYNANPGSMANAIETLYLVSQHENKRPVFIFGRMGELGKHSETLHSELGEKIAKYKIPLSLTIKGDCSITAQTAYKKADYAISVNVFENLSELCDNLYKFVKPDDIILVKASRSERFEAVVEKLKKDFSGQ
ncbi:MAG: UDP-N-acetylmuramoyl-tripeptide--D-alanyl-D-alanine ligase [Planctomycetes bacterium ADurb.Bin401]|nr:MAG: UDP-N-acetylmuramoyl-tripeptide--D-alanyl-D-alanine ligase [Planctomycetes bacterium ADurb.Bin401]